VSNPCEIISSLQKAEKIYREGNELKLLSLIYELCDKFERLRAKPYSHRDGRMTDAKMEIDRSFAEVDCLKNVIRKSGLGDRRFRDLFREQFNITPNRYITLKKIEYAKALLSAGGVSVTEVSELCGFSDIYYFSKTFKKLCGTLPSRWK
jgi:AraC-like DNA-binding protein